jgi:hypothetical protein
LPEFVKEAETLSRDRGRRLLDLLKQEAAANPQVMLTTGNATTKLALIGEAAAVETRYFDLALIGWESGNPTSRLAAEAVIFGSGRPTVLLPELTGVTVSSMSQLPGTAVALPPARRAT